MTVYNKSDWTKNTTLLVMAGVPGYDYEAAYNIVDAYLAADAGGWDPTDNGVPTGPGEPTNGQTPQQASVVIIDREYNTTSTLTATFNINVTLQDTGSFPTGTTTADIFSALQTNMEDRISDLFVNDIKINSFGYTGKTITARTGGYLDATKRVAVASQINSSTNLTDPAAIATAYVRQAFSLNNTWMATKLYNRADYPIVVFVNKYTDTTFATLDVSYVDGADTISYQGYVVYIDPVTYKAQTCLISPLSTTLS